jgi:hypothetical protein
MRVNYYESVLDFMGEENTKEFYKLYSLSSRNPQSHD